MIMKIRNVETTLHKVPVIDPVTHRETLVNSVITKIETDNGITGYSEVNGRSDIREFVNRRIKPILEGGNPLDTEMLWHELYRRLNGRAHTGVWSLGVSAVDIALWDIKGKYLSQPIYRLLGGCRQKVPAYITCGSGDPYEEYSPQEMAEFFKPFIKEGQDKVKMQVARGRWPALSKKPMTESVDYARVSAVRKEIGDGVQLSIDANCKLSLLEAIRLSKSVECFDIYWFEEPIYKNDASLLAQMRQKTSIPIAAGQNEGHKWKHLELFMNQSVDIAQPDVQQVGGFTEGLKVAVLAQAFNLPVATHAVPFENMHLVAAIDNGWRVEFHYATWKASESLWKDYPYPEKGWIKVPDRPGLGIKPNEKTLSETLVN
jgi:L-alanine-DL-glutamate epimerase-like enolase superfamily enzyme